MLKKLRFYSWLVKGIINRYQKTIIIFFVVGIILVVVSVTLVPIIKSNFASDHKVIGIVGTYSPSELPLHIQRLISAGLVDIDETGKPVPAVAEKWEILDEGKTYKFYLRQDLIWHDGQKFTSKDINYNLKDVEFVPLNDYQIEIKLKEPFVPLPNFLTRPLFRKNLVGLGSYKLLSVNLKAANITNLKLTRATTMADLPVLEYKFFAAEDIAKTAFKLGEVNVLYNMMSSEPFINWPDISIKENVQYDKSVAMFFNTSDGLLNVKEIRQALAYAIEKPETNRVLTPLSSKSWAYTTRVKQYDYDLNTAKDLLADQISSTSALTLSTFELHLPLAQRIASSWTQAGLETKVKVENGLPENFQALLAIQDIPTDPDQYMFWHSTQNESNITHYVNPKIDKLLEDGRKEVNYEKRKQIYFDLQRYLVDDAPAVFLFHPTYYLISRG